jgi:hypothetical protein
MRRSHNVFFCLLLLIYLTITPLLSGQIAPNSDATYQQLRNITLSGEAIGADGITLKRDAATFQFQSGNFCFLKAVDGKTTGAVFVGEGRLLLDPPMASEMASLSVLSREKEYSESFDRAVLRFTDNTYDELKHAAKPGTGGCSPDVLQASQRASRKEIHYNLDARILQDVLSPEPGGLFIAFVHGKHYDGKTLFTIDPHGVPELSPEEVSLETYGESRAGVWASFHLAAEYTTGAATSSQKDGVYLINHQKLDTTLEKSGRLDGKAVVSMTAQANGVRVVPLHLFPTLRVSSITGQNGEALNFVQEDKMDDPQFWVVLSKPLAKGEAYSLTITYGGKDAVLAEGAGNFYPVAREDWYPNSAYALLGEYTDYDMTFRVPKGMQIAATGSKVSESAEGNHSVSVWKSEVPITVAGFNFGSFKEETAQLQKPPMSVESYANTAPPDVANDAVNSGAPIGSLNTTQLNKRALQEAEFSLQIYSDYFGALPYKRLAMTQQTATNYGQSWPELVYLPITYLYDETARHFLGMDDPTGYFTVVAPHEVAHQWWGHDVGFACYRDQWMSEGFAHMSASLYLQLVYSKDPQKYAKFWHDQRRALVEKNKQGFRPIDVGPVTMGFRLSNTKQGYDVYRNLVYPKGAYILHMIRQMMYDSKNHDQRFKDTMHDFVATYSGHAATTEQFKAMVEKHMSAQMDLDGNHKMDWFFNEYVYGTALPAYAFTYTIENGPGGDIVMSMKLTQSGVTDRFRMLVPVYLELADGTIIRLGSASPDGNTTVEQKVPLKGLKQPPKRAMINYFSDVLAAN